jgi:hypothetical protein
LEDNQFDAYYQKERKLEVNLPPWIYNLARDAEPLWQVPGFEPECGKFNLLSFIAVTF